MHKHFHIAFKGETFGREIYFTYLILFMQKFLNEFEVLHFLKVIFE